MELKKTRKTTDNFVCEMCDFKCIYKCDYNRHIMRPKHLNMFTGHEMEIKNEKKRKKTKKNEFVCNICDKQFMTKSGLWKHNKISDCISLSNVTESNKTEPNVIHMIMEVVKQNNEFKELILEQNKQIIELSSKPTTTNNNTTNNNNNSFNLNFFLNETCKDAINISDFVSQLHVGINDLEETGRLGYAEGISKIFINGLKQLEINQRPVHCSDGKRETIYIKDKNQWEKDDDEKVKLTKAIRSVAHKNIEQISVWTEKHPEYMENNSKYNDKYMKLLYEAMPGSTKEESDKNYKKIARNITKETIIEK